MARGFHYPSFDEPCEAGPFDADGRARLRQLAKNSGLTRTGPTRQRAERSTVRRILRFELTRGRELILTGGTGFFHHMMKPVEPC
jgi:hypothetical protein